MECTVDGAGGRGPCVGGIAWLQAGDFVAKVADADKGDGNTRGIVCFLAGKCFERTRALAFSLA